MLFNNRSTNQSKNTALVQVAPKPFSGQVAQYVVSAPATVTGQASDDSSSTISIEAPNAE